MVLRVRLRDGVCYCACYCAATARVTACATARAIAYAIERAIACAIECAAVRLRARLRMASCGRGYVIVNGFHMQCVIVFAKPVVCDWQGHAVHWHLTKKIAKVSVIA